MARRRHDQSTVFCPTLSSTIVAPGYTCAKPLLCPQLTANPRKDRAHAKALGYIGGAIPRPFLHAATLFLLISSTLCHAQGQPYCGTTTVTSISPGDWFAGKEYKKVKIAGTGFTATPLQPGCIATVVSVTADTGGVALSDVTVVSSTLITATFKPQAHDPLETACVYARTMVIEGPMQPADSTAAATDASCSGPGYATAQILPAPKIKWNDNEISVIGDADSTPQNAVMGQQIKLATKPTAAQLIAVGLSFLSNTWTAGPASGPSNNVGGYNPSSASAHVKQTVLTKSDLTTYWLYPQSDNPLTYQYCVNIPGLSPENIANGLNCSLVAKATFNVSGPTATIVPKTTTWHVSRPIPVCSSTEKEQMLTFGALDQQASTTCNLIVDKSGITFNATVNTVSGSSGQTEWIQVISTNTAAGSTVFGTPFSTNGGTGLDNSLPYNINNPDPVDATSTTTNDSPNDGLGVDDANLTRTFTAKMYLIWTSQISDSIPVPLGYVTWEISGTATANETNTPPWSLTSSAPTKKNFHVSKDNDTKTHGLPTWSNLVRNTLFAATGDEEEEQQ